MKNQKGITLVALVITIVVLIILAGVAINFAMGDNGIITRALNAKEQYTQEEIKEKLSLKIADIQIEKQGNATLNDLDGLTIEGYNVTTGDIGRMVTVTKDSETYIFWVDSNLNITEFDGNISIENSNNSNTNSNTTIQDFTPTISNINGTYFTIEANATSSVSTVVVYEFFVNGEYKGLTLAKDSNTMDITGLELDTEYEVYVVALDDKGTIRKSTVVNQKTLDKLYLYKDGQEDTIASQNFSTFAQNNSSSNMVKNENTITLNTSCNSTVKWYRGLGKAIELNGEFTKLYINVVNVSLGSAWFTIGEYKNDGGIYLTTDKYVEIDNTSEKTYVLDITGITGTKIIGIEAYGQNTTNITFDKMWLEK